VGGAMALVIGVGFFPADPLKLLWDAERGVLRSLARILERCSAPAGPPSAPASTPSGPPHRDVEPEMDWVLAASHDVHRRLTALTQARATAKASTRVAPRRMAMRSVVEAEEIRIARMYLLASAVLSLMRTIADIAGDAATALPERVSEVHELAATVGALLDAPRPLTQPAVREAEQRMRGLQGRPLAREPLEGALLSNAVRRDAPTADVIARLSVTLGSRLRSLSSGRVGLKIGFSGCAPRPSARRRS
jgi:hypothetical protein